MATPQPRDFAAAATMLHQATDLRLGGGKGSQERPCCFLVQLAYHACASFPRSQGEMAKPIQSQGKPANCKPAQTRNPHAGIPA